MTKTDVTCDKWDPVPVSLGYLILQISLRMFPQHIQQRVPVGSYVQVMPSKKLNFRDLDPAKFVCLDLSIIIRSRALEIV